MKLQKLLLSLASLTAIVMAPVASAAGGLENCSGSPYTIKQIAFNHPTAPSVSDLSIQLSNNTWFTTTNWVGPSDPQFTALQRLAMMAYASQQKVYVLGVEGCPVSGAMRTRMAGIAIVVD